MKKTKSKVKSLFLSYSWKNSDIADIIYSDLSNLPRIHISRDVRDIKYKDNIKSFMESIRDHDYAIVLLSDSFLKSKNCMYEVISLLKEKNYLDKVLPIGLKNSDKKYYKNYEDRIKKDNEFINLEIEAKIYDDIKKAEYIIYWEEQLNKLKLTLSKINEELNKIELLSSQKRLDKICKNIGEFMQVMSDMNYTNIDELLKSNYKIILEHIGLEDLEARIFERLIDIWRIKDFEKQEIGLMELSYEYGEKDEFYFLRGLIYSKNGKVNIAKYCYGKAIEINPEYADAHNNLGVLLKDHFRDYQEAKVHYEKAIEINPEDAKAHNHLGILLEDYFKDYQGAKVHYEKAIEINPEDADTRYNLGNLLEIHFKDYQEAKVHYEKAIEINPEDAKAHNHLGILLEDYFKDYQGAKAHYETAIEINSEYADAYNNLKVLLEVRFKDYQQTKVHYQKQ